LNDHQTLSNKLNYQFQQAPLLKMALTHRSAADSHNERLEFLGDSLLGYLIADRLFKQFPKAREGQLTRLRASLVKGETLAEIARGLNLGNFLILGSGELKNGGWRRESILADTLEAIIGAVYMDGGLSACEQLIDKLYYERLKSLSLGSIEKDPKTRLQEYLQAKQCKLPKYLITAIEGDDHNQIFKVSCDISELDKLVLGQGRSRRHAEQSAAKRVLKLLKK